MQTTPNTKAKEFITNRPVLQQMWKGMIQTKKEVPVSNKKILESGKFTGNKTQIQNL